MIVEFDRSKATLTPATMSALPANGGIGPSRGPASSTSGINFLTRMRIVWHRGKAKANRLIGNSPLWTRSTQKSICHLPHEIVEMIIAHLTLDLVTLRACAMTCRSWNAAAVPLLHHTLVLQQNQPGTARRELKSLSKLHELGLIPLVKEIQVRQSSSLYPWFAPVAFTLDSCDFRYFTSFSNVQTLRLQNLNMHPFMPHIERFFEQFSPTLRSITLFEPRCSLRQLSHFFSLFPNLDNIEIWRISTDIYNSTAVGDAALVPFSAPRLRGELVLHDFRWVGTWEHLITVCGGLRFHSMDLRGATGCVSILLEACTDTLETLQLYVEGRSCGFFPELLPEFDLSRLKVLRSLQIGAWVAGPTPADVRDTAVMEVFSTITSPVFSELVIVVGNAGVSYIPSEVTLFETLRAMYEGRPFKLVFLLEVEDPLREEARRELVKALDSVTAKGLLDFLDSPPTIRRVRCRRRGRDVSFPDFD